MPYRVLSATTVADIGSTEAGDEELMDAQAIEKGLNHLEKDGWDLVQVIPERRSWDEDGERDGYFSARLVFKQR